MVSPGENHVDQSIVFGNEPDFVADRTPVTNLAVATGDPWGDDPAILAGAALAFLIAGPATNAATIAMVWRVLGRGTAASAHTIHC